MPLHTFILNGKRVSVDVENNVRLLWVLRDKLGVTGPKYGCGLGVCQACTCHLNGKAFNTCSVPISAIRSSDRITTIEGLPATVGKELHPMQQAWLDVDVAQCGYCQPGQIMTAVSLVRDVRAKGRNVTEADLDKIRNVCRCGTYPRIREAIKLGESRTPRAKRKKAKPKAKPKAKAKAKVKSPSQNAVPDLPLDGSSGGRRERGGSRRPPRWSLSRPRRGERRDPALRPALHGPGGCLGRRRQRVSSATAPGHRADRRAACCFPSWLAHQSLPYDGEKERIIISFNASIHASEGDQLHDYEQGRPDALGE